MGEESVMKSFLVTVRINAVDEDDAHKQLSGKNNPVVNEIGKMQEVDYE